jgi:hypothetical protein
MYVLLFTLKEEMFRWKPPRDEHGISEIAYYGIDAFNSNYTYTVCAKIYSTETLASRTRMCVFWGGIAPAEHLHYAYHDKSTC